MFSFIRGDINKYTLIYIYIYRILYTYMRVYVCVSASGMYIYIYSHVKNICIYLHIYGSLLHATGGPCTRYIYKCHVQTQRFPAKDASHADVFDCRSRTGRRLGPDPCHASRGERCWAVTLCSFPLFWGSKTEFRGSPLNLTC